jgi:hypothetical protein
VSFFLVGILLPSRISSEDCFSLFTVATLLVCRHLTDMAVFELAGLANLQRLSLVRVQKLTDNAVFFLAEHAKDLERLHLSYCDRLSLPAVQLLLQKLVKLQHLTATGIPAFRRKGIRRFSDPPPSVNITFLPLLVVTYILSKTHLLFCFVRLFVLFCTGI